MIDVFGTYATLSVLHPCAADRTDVVIEYLLPPAVAADPRLQGDVDELIRFMEIVVEQDTDVAERAQRGIASRAFERGVYPDKDAALHAFNERYRALTGAD
jgi:phenylpropionate dioxygenase-like ring-hydroxylating dioxygenase large terminal subunit